MPRRKEVEISGSVVVFKGICIELYESQESDVSYDEIVNMVISTKYGALLQTEEGLSLEEIAFIYDVTRERIRQIEEDAIGKRRVGLSNRNSGRGKLMAVNDENVKFREYVKGKGVGDVQLRDYGE